MRRANMICKYPIRYKVNNIGYKTWKWGDLWTNSTLLNAVTDDNIFTIQKFGAIIANIVYMRHTFDRGKQYNLEICTT